MESEKIQMENGKIQVENETSPALKRSRFMYICEAALEYLIAILVSGSFLATLTKSLGMSDSLTGVLSSVISLGCLFQLLSAVYRRQQVKRFVVILSVLNQLLFMMLYVIPLGGGGKQLKIVAFAVVIILAYLLYNIAHPKKISWLMALVEDGHRGRFTANKEIVSLVIGMAFSFSMGVVVDYFSGRNESSGSLRWDSGLWHHRHRSGQPFRKTVVRMPGPSLIANFLMSNTVPVIGMIPRGWQASRPWSF